MTSFLFSITLIAIVANAIAQTPFSDIYNSATEIRGVDNITKALENIGDITGPIKFVFSSTNLPSVSSLTTDLLNLNTQKLDWREKNAVTEPGDQGKCGAGWAFAAVGALEGQYSIKYGRLRKFSVSQVLDCDGGGRACNGVLLDKSPLYFTEVGGLQSDASYPYHNQDGREHECDFNRRQLVRFTVVALLKAPGEALIESMVRTTPVLVEMNPARLESYDGGIIRRDLAGCRPTGYSPLHHVLIVGFNNEADVPYWIVKNSYGTQWGDNGYFKIEKGVNACGIENLGTILIIA